MTTLNTPTCILEFIERAKLEVIRPSTETSRELARASIRAAVEACDKRKAEAEAKAIEMVYVRRQNEK